MFQYVSLSVLSLCVSFSFLFFCVTHPSSVEDQSHIMHDIITHQREGKTGGGDESGGEKKEGREGGREGTEWE